MILAVDIGNTNINIALFKGKQFLRKHVVPVNEKPRYLACLRNKLEWNKIDDAIICSVVPRVAKILELDIKKLLGRQPHVLGKNIKVPIKNLYRYPKQVGQDRLVNAYAGIMLYGAPLIVVDFGTAVTFDVVSRHKEYLGGMILPGLEISLDALNKRTALLPKIKLEKPRLFIGRDTKNSMLSGIIYGFAALTDDLAVRIKEKIGENAKVVGTGGNIGLIGEYCKQIDRIDRHLTLRGLNFILLRRKPQTRSLKDEGERRTPAKPKAKVLRQAQHPEQSRRTFGRSRVWLRRNEPQEKSSKIPRNLLRGGSFTMI